VVPNILSDGKLDNDPNTRIEVDANEDNDIAWTNEGKTIHYSYSGDQGKDILLHVTKQGDRNYKATQADGILHIIGAKENVLTLSTPGKIIYGDHFTIMSTQDDTNSTNVTYTFETDNQVFVSVPQVNGNKAEFDALRNSGNTQITITVTREAAGEVPLSKQVKIKVLPKPITIQIDDKEKKRLEDNPSLTYQDFRSQLVTWNGIRDEINESVIQLSTTAKKYSPVGSYPITAKGAIQQLNENYPNYSFTLKEGTLNIRDNENKDFWDIDDDGCPDLNIKLKDENGNSITINGDLNEDGIPDYNIDSNGDGKADLNIDTDNDGKPDINLVILKEWKPNQCVTVNGEQYSSGITTKAEINIDVDGDQIPDIDIDTNGDFKADYNIDTDGDGKANVNIGPLMSEWKPNKDYMVQKFTYDTMNDLKPVLNIDTDGDGYPDLNIDLDADGKPDINIDTDGDLIPDVDIDSTGDGKPDINVDNDGDGKPDENLMDITEWKPDHNVDSPMEYDTMKIEDKNELEDNGVIIENPDGTPFPPNWELQVEDVTVNEKANVINKMGDQIAETQEVKKVYDVKLLEDGKDIQPEGTLKIKIPIDENMINAYLVKLNENGKYERIEAILENGYLVYESDELGIVSIIADIVENEPSNEIKGSYYPGDNVGGALTGDTTDTMLYISIGWLSLGILLLILFKYNLKETN
ncbi:MAG: hypothetical protein HFE67_08935, partial [Erysipelotrichaceae bacterium]|nr:hypothetical protein [Erysipelotrichaceae bacterium]